MKKYFLASLGLAAIAWQVSAPQTAKAVTPHSVIEEVTAGKQTPASGTNNKTFGPEISFEKTRHNFGTIKQGVPVKVKFVFENKGNSNLVIKKATAGCGCTTPVHPKEPIAPGKKGEIEVGYDAKAIGNFVKDITIDTNAGTVKLTITGVVEVEASDNMGNEIKLPTKK